MEIFNYDWIIGIITALGTLFLIGELLVNMRGLFAILGLAFIVTYFTVYLEPGSFTLIFIIYLLGLFLIIIDGNFVNDGTLGVIGLVLMLVSVAIAAPNFFAGLYAIIGVLAGGAGSLLFLKVFHKRNLWGKLTLKDRLTSEAGYQTMNQEYASLVDKQGITISVLRPVGTIRIDGKEYSGVSNGQWIEKGTAVKVVEVDGTKILVEEVNE